MRQTAVARRAACLEIGRWRYNVARSDIPSGRFFTSSLHPFISSPLQWETAHNAFSMRRLSSPTSSYPPSFHSPSHFSSFSSSSSPSPPPSPLSVAIPSTDFPGFSIKGRHFLGRGCYIDCAATTPLDPRVLDKMMPFMTEQFGNPHSRTHHFGWTTEEAVEEGRTHLAALLAADPKEIVFTSGATESNNLAIKGAAHFYQSKKKHIITTQTEHKCVLDSCRSLEQEGFEVTYLPVKKDGIVDMEVLNAAIRPDTSLVSVMFVNNEIGVIQPIKEIGALCRSKGIRFHTDAAQAYGKIPIDVNEMNIDLLSISGHKIYGPKGVGAIYIRRKPRIKLQPILSGGGQERGFRSGTLPAPLCVGLGEAARICKEEMEEDSQHINRLSKKLMDGISSRLTHVQLNGSSTHRYPGCVNFSFSCVEGESLIMALPEVAVSSGSACTSASLEPSYVLRALQVDEEMAHTSIRFGIGRFTTEEEIDHAIDSCVKNVNKLREISALWDLVQDGVDLKTIQWTEGGGSH